MKVGFGFGDMGESGGGNEMSYDFIYSAIKQDPQVQRKLDDVRLMIAELEHEVEQLKSIIETLKAALQALLEKAA